MQTTMKCAAAILAALLGTAGSASAQTRVIIATSGSGTPSYALGSALASAISKNVRGYSADTDLAGSPEDGVKAVGRGKASLVFLPADAAFAASRGEGEFKSGKVALRAIAAINPYRIHVIAFSDAGITRLADLRGKRVSTGPAASATEAAAARLLEFAGLAIDKDIRRERLTPAETLVAMKDGKIDAAFLAGSVPIPAARDIATLRPARFIDTAAGVDAVNKKYGPLYTKGAIPAKSYPGQSGAVGAAESWVILACAESMNPQVAYNVTKTLFERKSLLAAMHSDAASLSLPKQREVKLPIAFHPGALKYLAEKGVRPRQ